MNDASECGESASSLLLHPGKLLLDVNSSAFPYSNPDFYVWKALQRVSHSTN